MSGPELRLPHLREPERSVMLDSVGRALRGLYEDLVAEGVPEHLAKLVHRLDDRIDNAVGDKQIALVVEDDAELRDVARAVLEETNPRRRDLRDRRGRISHVAAARRQRGFHVY